MARWNQKSLAVIGLVGLISLSSTAAIAKDKKDKNREKDRRPVPVQVVPTTGAPTVIQTVTLTDAQRLLLVNVIRGTGDRADLLTPVMRTQILSQVNSLPPGIRKQLLRGKGLPPGIAKKLIPIPVAVNSYLGIPANSIQLYAIGSDVLVMNSLNKLILDIIPL